ncbi:GTPase SLIP-GC protein [Ceratobasidium sp. AG-Ba]|nr:GTPase SLIP-GC protein [Ceratobasidium sp. AG-Ba]
MSFSPPKTAAAPASVKPEPQSPSYRLASTSYTGLQTTPPAPLRYPTAFPTPQASTSTGYVKPEPSEPPSLSDLAKLAPYALVKSEVKHEVKPDIKPEVHHVPKGPLLPKPTHKIYNSADEIDYTPENALAEGVQMAKTIGSYLNEIDLGSQLRKDVWLREVESLKNQGAPHTMIAVCGATGAGKSSLLNAVLDDNIVPTSGMRACTAVVTEIAYHNKSTIAADVEFLALSEWKAELEILLDDLVEEDGTLKRLTDLRNDSGVAWHKMHAVYPLLSPERMVRMTPDEIIHSHPEVRQILGTTRKIESPNSEKFANEISKYIDSKDQKRGKDKDKDKKKEKSGPGDPALWPLIRSVRVKCKANALSCGAVLVDLPGVADANLARSSIAKDYMKKCDCIWIAAPITRAVDDKTAKDLLGEAFRTQLMNGNYDDSTVTFIATKTDDLSCHEVIGALGLSDDPELLAIENQLEEALSGTDQWSAKLEQATKDKKAVDTEIKRLHPIILEYKEHLVALRSGEQFEPILTAPKSPEGSSSKKRKRGGGGRSAKRRRGDDGDDMDDFIVDDDEDEDAIVEDVLDDDEVIEIDSDSDDIVVLSDSDDAAPAGEVTEESLKETIKKKEAELGVLRQRVAEHKKIRLDAVAKLNEFKKAANKLQKDKNSFCSIKRNEYSRDVLKEDFRAGLKQLDQQDAEAKNPDTFDPSEELRDYAAIDLPVFTCSSRDYIRINKQVKGDGGPSCFVNVEDTGIPALQRWCHQLTVSARERSARSLINNLATFLRSIRAYMDDIEGVSVADRIALAEMWESNVLPSDYGENLGLTEAHRPAAPQPAAPPMPYYGRARRHVEPQPEENSLSGMYRRAQQLQEVQRMMAQHRGAEDQKGISFRLRNSMEKVVKDCVAELKRAFRDGIEERCRSGAEKARLAALQTSDEFAASMHWASYRATLRRNGEYRSDLNAELIAPMTREIASSWAQVFDSDLFAPMERAEKAEIVKLLKEIEETAPAGLKDRCRLQAQTTLKEAEVVTRTILQNIKTAMTNEQKEISRCLTPHVKNELLTAYYDAMLERGTGSVARQKLLFHNFVDRHRATIFRGGADQLFGKLDAAAESVGLLLQLALNELSEKIEVSMSALWEIPNDAAEHLTKRRELVKRVHTMLGQLKLWATASKRVVAVESDADAAVDFINDASSEVDAMMQPASDADDHEPSQVEQQLDYPIEEVEEIPQTFF